MRPHPGHTLRGRRRGRIAEDWRPRGMARADPTCGPGVAENHLVAEDRAVVDVDPLEPVGAHRGELPIEAV